MLKGRIDAPQRDRTALFLDVDGTLLVVNPHEGVAAALKRALEMPLTERRERHGPMLEHLLVHNVKLWAESYLSALTETRQRPSLISDLRAY
jgi:trehalose 6-phosphate synthase